MATNVLTNCSTDSSVFPCSTSFIVLLFFVRKYIKLLRKSVASNVVTNWIPWLITFACLETCVTNFLLAHNRKNLRSIISFFLKTKHCKKNGSQAMWSKYYDEMILTEGVVSTKKNTTFQLRIQRFKIVKKILKIEIFFRAITIVAFQLYITFGWKMRPFCFMFAAVNWP